MMIMHGRAVMRDRRAPWSSSICPSGVMNEAPNRRMTRQSGLCRKRAVRRSRLKPVATCLKPSNSWFGGASPSLAMSACVSRPPMSMVGSRPKAARPSSASVAWPRPMSWTRPGRSPWSSKASPETWPDEITSEVSIPTIGIGASPSCDGQILVTDDMIGQFDWTPKIRAPIRRHARAGHPSGPCLFSRRSKRSLSRSAEIYTFDA
jgi:3-methyl-2-oxobutanoate hydroxymethyltransferase